MMGIVHLLEKVNIGVRREGHEPSVDQGNPDLRTRRERLLNRLNSSSVLGESLLGHIRQSRVVSGTMSSECWLELARRACRAEPVLESGEESMATMALVESLGCCLVATVALPVVVHLAEREESATRNALAVASGERNSREERHSCLIALGLICSMIYNGLYNDLRFSFFYLLGIRTNYRQRMLHARQTLFHMNVERWTSCDVLVNHPCGRWLAKNKLSNTRRNCTRYLINLSIHYLVSLFDL